MNAFFKITVTALLTLSPWLSFSQEISEENYLKADKEIWETADKETEALRALLDAHPEKKDSLQLELKKVYRGAQRKNQETAIKYASVPSGLQRLYMLRLSLPKDTLRAVLNRIPEEMRASPYGQSIALHIATEQIQKGSPYYNFQSTTSNGEAFALSSLVGKKQVLLLYGGLGCMGESGRDFLAKLYRETDREHFEIVVFWPTDNLEELQKIKAYFPNDYLCVSDFKGDHTPMKIIYGAQATPTCFLIDKAGMVTIKSGGLPTEELEEILAGGGFN